MKTYASIRVLSALMFVGALALSGCANQQTQLRAPERAKTYERDFWLHHSRPGHLRAALDIPAWSHENLTVESWSWVKTG